MKTQSNKSKENSTTGRYLVDQELIWDSGAGFDVVSYKGHSDLLNGTMLNCKLKTGIKKGQVIPIDAKQLGVFSLKKWAEMRKRYDNVA